MGKILGSWSGMRKYLENEMLAESLRGRVRYSCTSYVGMDGCHIFTVAVDGKDFKKFSWETVNSYFINNGMKQNNEPYGVSEYWDGFWELAESIPVTERDEYMDSEFCDALEQYRNTAVGQSLAASDPIRRMFAVLDRRVGRRTLEKLKATVDEQPEWLQNIYRLRLEAENIA